MVTYCLASWKSLSCVSLKRTFVVSEHNDFHLLYHVLYSELSSVLVVHMARDGHLVQLYSHGNFFPIYVTMQCDKSTKEFICYF